MLQAVVFFFTVGCVLADIPRVPFYGTIEPGNEGRIILGEDANEGEFPSIASLRRAGYNPGHTCGATILTADWALTASHCCAPIKQLSDFYLYVGSIYLDRGGSSHKLAKMIMHENYQQQNNFRNDICLLKVSQPFKFVSGRVEQVQLAPPNFPVPGGERVNAAGWGLTNANSNKVPNRLQKGINFVTLSQEECGRLTKLNMFPGYLCVKGRIPGQTVWQGDSGGPLYKDGAQVGLTSFGFFPYGNNLPAVFCRVIHYISWIKQKMGPDASQLKFKQ